MSAIIPAGRIIRVEFETRLTAAATTEEIQAWINFELGWGMLPSSNPLKTDIEYHGPAPRWTDTGKDAT